MKNCTKLGLFASHHRDNDSRMADMVNKKERLTSSSLRSQQAPICRGGCKSIENISSLIVPKRNLKQAWWRKSLCDWRGGRKRPLFFNRKFEILHKSFMLMFCQMIIDSGHENCGRMWMWPFQVRMLMRRRRRGEGEGKIVSRQLQRQRRKRRTEKTLVVAPRR